MKEESGQEKKPEAEVLPKKDTPTESPRKQQKEPKRFGFFTTSTVGVIALAMLCVTVYFLYLASHAPWWPFNGREIIRETRIIEKQVTAPVVAAADQGGAGAPKVIVATETGKGSLFTRELPEGDKSPKEVKTQAEAPKEPKPVVGDYEKKSAVATDQVMRPVYPSPPTPVVYEARPMPQTVVYREPYVEPDYREWISFGISFGGGGSRSRNYNYCPPAITYSQPRSYCPPVGTGYYYTVPPPRQLPYVTDGPRGPYITTRPIRH